MLNELESRIIRYMLKQRTKGSISINFKDVNPSYLIEAIRSLAEKGYVKNNSTLISIAATLTAKGKYGYEEEIKMMYGAFSDKINQIEYTIDEGLSLIHSLESDKIVSYLSNVLIVYENQFSEKTMQLIRNDLERHYSNISVCHHILEQVISKLKSFLSDVKIEADKQKTSNSTIVQNVFNPQNSVNIEISLNNVLRDISKTSLSEEDQIKLQKLLDDVEKSKNKKSLWGKITDTLKYLLDKGIEIGAIVLPFLSQFLIN